MTGGYSQQARVLEATVAAFRPWNVAYEDMSVDAWRAVQRITPEVAAQEQQAIAEMIAHLEAVQFAAGGGA